MVGTEFRLNIHQAADAMVNGRRVSGFFSIGPAKRMNSCGWDIMDDFVFFKTHTRWSKTACHGEVWTDEKEKYTSHIGRVRIRKAPV